MTRFAASTFSAFDRVTDPHGRTNGRGTAEVAESAEAPESPKAPGSPAKGSPKAADPAAEAESFAVGAPGVARWKKGQECEASWRHRCHKINATWAQVLKVATQS